MPFDWKEYLEFARRQQAATGSAAAQEAAWRSALSRAYYAAYCHARNYARDWLAFRPRDDGIDHGRLRAHLKLKKRTGVAIRLDWLRGRRNECDYRDDLTFPLPGELMPAFAHADYVFRSLMPPASP